MCFFAPTPHPGATWNDARNYIPCIASVVQSGWIWREDIWLVVEAKTTHCAGGLHDAPVSKLACWPCAQALQDRLPSAHRLSYPLAWQPGHELHEMPHEVSVAVRQDVSELTGTWPCTHMAVRSWRSGQGLSRPVLSSLCLLLLWHQHLPRCLGVTGHALCSLTPSVSSALLLADRAGLKRAPEGREHQSSGSGTWGSLLAGVHG